MRIERRAFGSAALVLASIAACAPARIDARSAEPREIETGVEYVQDTNDGAPLDATIDIADARGDADTIEAGLIDAAAPRTAEERLHARAIGADNWAQRDFVTWTTRAQVEAMREDKKLLVSTSKMHGPPSPFAFLVEAMATRRNATGAIASLLAKDPRFVKRRYAWTNAFATVLGLATKTYGDELVRVRLREDAWVVMLAPEQSPQLVVRDLEQHEIALDRAIAEPQRIGAVYHVRRGADVPAHYREYVLVNEAAIERWAVGTEDVKRTIDDEATLLADLVTDLARAAPTRSLVRAWDESCAFENRRYVFEAKNLQAARAALAKWDRTQAPLEVRP